MMGKKFETSYQIKEFHLDTFGHVNHATYLQILEDVRWDIIGENGFSLENIQKEKKGPIILDYQIKYKRELVNREEVRIETWLDSVVKKFMILKQVIYKLDGEVSAEAQMTVGYFDMNERKLLSPTKEWLQAIGHE